LYNTCIGRRWRIRGASPVGSQLQDLLKAAAVRIRHAAECWLVYAIVVMAWDFSSMCLSFSRKLATPSCSGQVLETRLAVLCFFTIHRYTSRKSPIASSPWILGTGFGSIESSQHLPHRQPNAFPIGPMRELESHIKSNWQQINVQYP